MPRIRGILYVQTAWLRKFFLLLSYNGVAESPLRKSSLQSGPSTLKRPARRSAERQYVWSFHWLVRERKLDKRKSEDFLPMALISLVSSTVWKVFSAETSHLYLPLAAGLSTFITTKPFSLLSSCEQWY